MSNPNASWAHVNQKLTRPKQIYAALEATPDINRGEQRLAAEIALALTRGEEVPLCIARERGLSILQTMARG